MCVGLTLKADDKNLSEGGIPGGISSIRNSRIFLCHWFPKSAIKSWHLHTHQFMISK